MLCSGNLSLAWLEWCAWQAGGWSGGWARPEGHAPPAEETGASGSRGTVTALEAADVMGEGAWQRQPEKKLGTS